MTAVPTDDRAAATAVEQLVGPPLAPEHPSADARDRPVPWWRPVEQWKSRGHRVLPGITYPITIYVIWRLASLWAVIAVDGGRAVETAYNYDGEHYLRILHYGYWNPRPIMPSHAFFPGIPWLGVADLLAHRFGCDRGQPHDHADRGRGLHLRVGCDRRRGRTKRSHAAPCS